MSRAYGRLGKLCLSQISTKQSLSEVPQKVLPSHRISLFGGMWKALQICSFSKCSDGADTGHQILRASMFREVKGVGQKQPPSPGAFLKAKEMVSEEAHTEKKKKR